MVIHGHILGNIWGLSKIVGHHTKRKTIVCLPQVLQFSNIRVIVITHHCEYPAHS